MRFSIIIPHYQGSVLHETFLRCVASIRAQTFREFELLVYHDGPLLHPQVQFPCKIKCTDARFNDYGHSLRDVGIREATGDYLLHLNADGVLYPNALELISREIDRKSAVINNESGTAADTNDMVLFPIIMRGLITIRGGIIYTTDKSISAVMTGHPPVLANIDAMQLVVRRDIWIREGGWYDKRPDGDGYMYEKFCAKYGYRTVGAVLGEHW